MNASPGPVYKSPLLSSTEMTDMSPEKFIDCPRCGKFLATLDAIITLQGEIPKGLRWAITSHAIRSMQTPGGGSYRVTPAWLTSVWGSPKLPNPQMQADRFVEYLGTAGIPSEWVWCRPQELMGLFGTADDPSLGKTGGFTYIIERLRTKGLIEQHRHPEGGKIGYRLTFDGWERFEELHRVTADSRIAFMAMGYGNPDVDRGFYCIRSGCRAGRLSAS